MGIIVVLHACDDSAGGGPTSGPPIGGAPACAQKELWDFDIPLRYVDHAMRRRPAGGWVVPMFQDQALLVVEDDGTELARIDMSVAGISNSSAPAEVYWVSGALYLGVSALSEEGVATVSVYEVGESALVLPMRSLVTLPGYFEAIGAPTLIPASEGVGLVVPATRWLVGEEDDGESVAPKLWYAALGASVVDVVTPVNLQLAWAGYPAEWSASNRAGSALSATMSGLVVLDDHGAVLSFSETDFAPIAARDDNSWFRTRFETYPAEGEPRAVFAETFGADLQTISTGSPAWTCLSPDWGVCGWAHVYSAPLAGDVAGALLVWQRQYPPPDDTHAEVVLTRVDHDGNAIGCSLYFEGGYAYPTAAALDGDVASVFWLDGWPDGALSYHAWSGVMPDE